MGLFDFLKKPESAKETKELSNQPVSENTGIIFESEQMLMEVSTDLSLRDTVRVPVAEIASLGGGLSSMLPSLHTITQTASSSGSGLYKLANANIGDALKLAKDGNYWAAFTTSDGGSKMVKLMEAGPIETVTKTVAPINPVMIAMAATLADIEKKLGEIADMEKQILDFLVHEKEAQIEGDLKTLVKMVRDYKYNWDNKLYCSSNHKQVLDIKRSADQNIILYQKNIGSVIKANPGLIFRQADVGNKKEALQKDFKYYKMSLYIYSFASMMEVLFSGNFKEEYLQQIRSLIRDYSIKYREFYTECYGHIEQLASGAIETQLANGLGDALHSVGDLFGGKGAVAEWFKDRSDDLKRGAKLPSEETLSSFSQIKDPGNTVFIDSLNRMKMLYSNTTEIYFNKDSVYLAATA